MYSKQFSSIVEVFSILKRPMRIDPGAMGARIRLQNGGRSRCFRRSIRINVGKLAPVIWEWRTGWTAFTTPAGNHGVETGLMRI